MSQEDRNRDERNLAVTEYMVREIASMREELLAELRVLQIDSGTKPESDTKK